MQWARLVYILALFVLLAVAPWWLFVAALILGVFLFHAFFEVLVFAMAADLIYGAGASTGEAEGLTVLWQNLSYTIPAAAALIVAELAKGHMKFYN